MGGCINQELGGGVLLVIIISISVTLCSDTWTWLVYGRRFGRSGASVGLKSVSECAPTDTMSSARRTWRRQGEKDDDG